MLASLTAWALSSNHSSQANQATCSAPSFLTARLVHPFSLSGPITTADFNGDDHLDLVTLTGDKMAILLGDGAGNFGSPAFFLAGPAFVLSLAVGDLNNDGKLDVVRAGFENGFESEARLSVFLGDGAGGFGTATTFLTTGAFEDIVLMDFNGDQKLDLAGSSFSGLWVMVGDGTGAFSAAVRYPVAGSILSQIEAADFNGDGKPDLVVSPNADKVSVLLNDGSGHFNTVKDFATYKRALELVASDINGDGKADVVAASSHGVDPNNISVLLGDGAGNLAAPINTPIPVIGSLSSGDFNGDGKPDLMTGGSNRFGILLGDGTGHFSAPREFYLGGAASSPEAVLGDFNEDGKLDVATNLVTVSFGDGAGRLLAPATFRIGIDPVSTATGDFNEDGRTDLLVSTLAVSNVWLLLADASGGYAPATSFAVGPQPKFVAVADFNGDRHLDFVTANSGTDLNTPEVGTVSIRLGDGAGNFAPASNFPSGYAPGSLVVADFNKDGKLDLVVANMGFTTPVTEVPSKTVPASITILIGDGAGSFEAPRALSNEWSNLGLPASLSVAMGDLNSDGNLDLVVAKSTTLSVVLGDGTGQFAASINYAVPRILVSLVVGDFDKDAKLDVATIYDSADGQESDSVSIRLGDGAGNLGAARDSIVATNLVHIAAGDFNSDSNLDLAVANGGLSIAPGDGSGGLAPPTVLGVSAKSVTVDDLNGDGNRDLAIIPAGPHIDYIIVVLNNCGGAATPTPTPTPTPTATPTPTPTPSPSPTPSPGPQLLTDEGANRAVAFDSVTFTRDPFAVRTTLNFSPDQRTRIILFASNLELLPGENVSVVTAQAEDEQHKVHSLPVEYVGNVPGFDWLTQVIVKLPDELDGAGSVELSVSLRGVVGNKAIINIRASE